ncbi:VOC family protein [Roseibium sp. RKSG952]|uniref:VOC family protein n=1 Tax=Roseibium sp. RKSG952 TaxID=2529384 RepID=UPI0013CD7895|nr:VOC family protein [Roseibium sp. RKSG952]MTH97980.1 VOC family protein [Roseibium sp. RKSG952]
MAHGLLQGVEGVFIPVSDPELSAAWYIEKLGCKAIFLEPEAAILRLSAQSPTVLGLVKARGELPVAFPDNDYDVGKFFNFLVDDFDRVRQTLEERDVPMGPVGGEGAFRYFTFFDPDGNPLGVCQSD